MQVSNTGDIYNFVQISILSNKTEIVRNLNEIVHISGNIERTNKADNILELKGYFEIFNARILLLKAG